MSMKIGNSTPSNKNISFSAQLNVNAKNAMFRGMSIISDKEIKALNEIAQKIGSKRDIINIEIGEATNRPLLTNHLKRLVKKQYDMTAFSTIKNETKTHDLNQNLTVKQITNFHSLFCDGFEKNTPFLVLKNFLENLKN